MKFNDKNEYIQWRSEWRANYKKLTQQIRDAKYARWFADSARHGVPMSEAQTARYNAIAVSLGCDPKLWCPAYVCLKLRKQASAMLEERKQSKIAAQESYAALRVHSYQ